MSTEWVAPATILAVGGLLVLAWSRLIAWQRLLASRRAADGPNAVVWTPFMLGLAGVVLYVLPAIFVAHVVWVNAGARLVLAVAVASGASLAASLGTAAAIHFRVIPRDKEMRMIGDRMADGTATSDQVARWNANESALRQARAVGWMGFGVMVVSSTAVGLDRLPSWAQLGLAGAIGGVIWTIATLLVLPTMRREHMHRSEATPPDGGKRASG